MGPNGSYKVIIRFCRSTRKRHQCSFMGSLTCQGMRNLESLSKFKFVLFKCFGNHFPTAESFNYIYTIEDCIETIVRIYIVKPSLSLPLPSWLNFRSLLYIPPLFFFFSYTILRMHRAERYSNKTHTTIEARKKRRKKDTTKKKRKQNKL